MEKVWGAEMAKPIFRPISFSMPDDGLIEAARERARELGLSFSSYIVHLIRRDLAEPGHFNLVGASGRVYRVTGANPMALNDAPINSLVPAETLEIVREAEKADEEEQAAQFLAGTKRPIAATTEQTYGPSAPVSRATRKKQSKPTAAQP